MSWHSTFICSFCLSHFLVVCEAAPDTRARPLSNILFVCQLIHELEVALASPAMWHSWKCLVDMFRHSVTACTGAFNSSDIMCLPFSDIPILNESDLNHSPPSSLMHLLLIEYKEWRPWLWSEMRSDMKYFLLVRLSSRSVCSAVAVDFCLWRQNVIANSNGAVFSSPGFPRWTWGIKARNEIRNAVVVFGALWCDVAVLAARYLQRVTCRGWWKVAICSFVSSQVYLVWR